MVLAVTERRAKIETLLDALDPALKDILPYLFALLGIQDTPAQLAQVDPQAAELVQLRYFAGLALAEAANVLAISPRTADRVWAYARAWLREAMGGS